MRIPETTSEFAVNASNERFWEPPVRRYVAKNAWPGHGPARAASISTCDGSPRWWPTCTGSCCAAASTCIRATARTRAKAGRLRLLYEANPAAMLIEQAGGAASTGRERILEVVAPHDDPPADQPDHGHPARGRAPRRLPRRPSIGASPPCSGRRCSTPVRSVPHGLMAKDLRSMSALHPVISVTGSSGAGTTTVKHTFDQIFQARGDSRRSSSRGTPSTASIAPRCGPGWTDSSRKGSATISAISAPRPISSPNSRPCSGTTAGRGGPAGCANICTTTKRPHPSD